jgi:hypothetical protein
MKRRNQKMAKNIQTLKKAFRSSLVSGRAAMPVNGKQNLQNYSSLDLIRQRHQIRYHINPQQPH